jgi:arginyl-tRNA synthetase
VAGAHILIKTCYMVDLVRELRHRVQTALRDCFGDDAGAIVADIHRSDHADYQADLALGLARRLRRDPRDIAAAVAQHLRPDAVLDTATVSGPGFINLALRAEYLSSTLGSMLADERLGVGRPEHPDTVVVDYSSPNLAKEMHVGHLRSTIIGDALARVLSFFGHRVVRRNHIGDWGTPFGMLIEHLFDERLAGRAANVRELSKFYRAARVKFDSDPIFAQRARQRVVSLQSGGAETLALWRQLIAVTLEHIDGLYRRLDITFAPDDVVGESHYNPDLADVVNELTQRGIAQLSDGAVCVFPPGFLRRDGASLPLIVRKQDGGFGYAATDLAALRCRLLTLRARQVLYVVGTPQHQHFAMVFAASRMAGWADDAVRLEHVGFGSVLGPDKKMLKSRSGESVSLGELLDEGIERARELVDEKSPGLDELERSAIAEVVGIGAIKYADLVNDRIKDYVFDWNRMLAFDGNTAPYLMYAHSRICSILGKVVDGEQERAPSPIRLDAPAERALAIELIQFPRTVEQTAETLRPHGLCQYLFKLATVFTGFYETCPVLRADQPVRASRISLCRLTARVLAKGLDILGIAAPKQM